MLPMDQMLLTLLIDQMFLKTKLNQRMDPKKLIQLNLKVIKLLIKLDLDQEDLITDQEDHIIDQEEIKLKITLVYVETPVIWLTWLIKPMDQIYLTPQSVSVEQTIPEQTILMELEVTILMVQELITVQIKLTD